MVSFVKILFPGASHHGARLAQHGYQSSWTSEKDNEQYPDIPCTNWGGGAATHGTSSASVAIVLRG